MMGYGRAGHSQHGRNIDDTFLAVAQQPENSDPGRIAQLLENIGYCLKMLYKLKLFLQKGNILPFVMMMG